MTVLKTIGSKLKRLVHGDRKRLQFYADGLGVRGRTLSFLEDDKFRASWNSLALAHAPYWNGAVPDIRWRCHFAIWAAECGLNLEGDFAEFGVYTGLLTSMIVENTNFGMSGKKYFLFDTFEGIPSTSISNEEAAKATRFNKDLYNQSSLNFVQSRFSAYPNIVLVEGILPASLSRVNFSKLAFVSIDLNVVQPEIAVGEAIWDSLSPGAFILLDDYGFKGHEVQHRAWNSFAQKRGRRILASPTGQGLLQK